MYDVFYILIFMQIIFTLIPYIKFRLGGSLISKHTFRKYDKLELLISLIAVLFLYLFAEYRFNSFGIYGALLISIYMLLAHIIANINILVSDKGFYYQGKYTQWQDVVSIHGDNENQLIIEKVAMVRSKQKIKEINDKRLFLETAKIHMITKS